MVVGVLKIDFGVISKKREGGEDGVIKTGRR